MANFTTLATFDETDGSKPEGPLVIDAQGDLFGTTNSGGANGVGTAFEIAKTANGYVTTPATLGAFPGGDSANPRDGVIANSNGNLYGVTQGQDAASPGAIYSFTRDAQSASGYDGPNTLASFGGTDGATPVGILVRDSAGDLFGVTQSGGSNNDGTVFELAAGASSPTTLVDFDGADGATPMAGLVMDAAGNLYGTTTFGGSDNNGTIFEIAKTASGYASTPTILYNFVAAQPGPLVPGPGAIQPEGPLMIDANGDLFGTTSGTHSNVATVFELPKTPEGYASGPTSIGGFQGGTSLSSSLIEDAAGNLFGVVGSGGVNNAGFVFEIAKTTDGYGGETDLHDFTSTDGLPSSGLAADAVGDLFGTTLGGSGSNGTVFELSAAGFESVALNGTVGLEATTDHSTINPFANATVADLNTDQTESVAVTLSNAANGTLSNLGHGSYDAATGTYTDTGTVSAVTADLQGLVFTPTEGQTAPGQTVTTGFTVTLTDSVDATSTNSTTAVIATASPADFTNLVNFNGVDGNFVSGLIADSAGNLFGATESGGAGNAGTVFELPKTADGYAGTPTVLASFDGANGFTPSGDLAMDSAGDLFGTTAAGTNNHGTIFEIAKTGTGYSAPSTLATFDGSNGQSPSGLLMDAAGNLFGTTFEGGANNLGTVFELAKTGDGYASAPTTLASFDSNDGAFPNSGLVMDAHGDLFGTTGRGGTSNFGGGVVFEIAKTADGYASTPTTIFNFNSNDQIGYYPGPLAIDQTGDLFGATNTGGIGENGTLFEIANNSGTYGTPELLTTFGASPYGNLMIDAAGDIFGTAGGGAAQGIVYELTKSAGDRNYNLNPTTLFNFADGGTLSATDSAGALFGATSGGPSHDGTVFALSNAEFTVSTTTPGETLTANDTPGQQLTGTPFNDTFNAGHSAVVMTSGGGADTFVFHAIPWSAGSITDFNTVTDKLDLSALLSAAGYTGSDPVADGYLSFDTSNSGGVHTDVYLNTHSASDPYPSLITTLDGILSSQITPADYGYGSSSGSGGTTGETLTANDTAGQQLTGTPNDDTFFAGHNSVVMTGNGGADIFIFQYEPWNAGSITDFTPGNDKLDLSTLLSAAGYSGSDPVNDGYVTFQSDGSGDTNVYFNPHDASQAWPSLITTLDDVSPSGLTAANTLGTAGSSSGGGGGTTGETLTANDTAGQQLTGTPNDDTFFAGHNSVVMTGNGGADQFVFQYQPWNAGSITDFSTADDVLNLKGIFAAIGYTGSNPVADGYLAFQSDGSGDTQVIVSPQGPSTQIPIIVTTLDHVDPSTIHASDYLFA